MPEWYTKRVNHFFLKIFYVFFFLEKEVSGEMLIEFCEEDIKDVFTEFKDRFLIRKFLRDFHIKCKIKGPSITNEENDKQFTFSKTLGVCNSIGTETSSLDLSPRTML